MVIEKHALGQQHSMDTARTKGHEQHCAAPLGEVVDHAREALPQRHLGLPAQRLLYLRDPRHASPVTHYPRNQLFMFPCATPLHSRSNAACSVELFFLLAPSVKVTRHQIEQSEHAENNCTSFLYTCRLLRKLLYLRIVCCLHSLQVGRKDARQ